MKPLLLWIAGPLVLLGASMLIAGVGSIALWIAVVTVGIALILIGRAKPGQRDGGDGRYPGRELWRSDFLQAWRRAQEVSRSGEPETSF